MEEDCVEVMFDYDYSMSDGRHITIARGEIFTLLAKSTDEWWKVRKDHKEKFYVPASYVRQVSSSKRTMNTVQQTPQQSSNHITVHSDIPSSISINGHHRTASNVSTGSDSSPNTQSRHSCHTDDVTHINPAMQDLTLQPTPTLTSDTSCSFPVDHAPAEYANMEIIEDIIAQRKENSELPSTDTSDSETWEMHTDDDSGKVYYFNSITKETTWDSPVIKRRSRLDKKKPSSASKRLSRVTSFRKGWTETIDEEGSRTYVHNATGEKWHMTRDTSGKEYYFNETTQESLWELPEGGYTLRNAAQSTNSFDTHKRGYLHRAKISEGGKKVKKNWSLAYVVAYDSNLLIYKDEKAAASKADAEYGNPEAIVDLTHAIVDWSSKEKSAKRNVLQVTSASGTCYLFQHSDNMLMHQWHTIILGKVKKFNPAVVDASDKPLADEAESNNNEETKNSGMSKRKLHSRRFSKYGGGKSVYTLHEENAEFQAPSSVGPAGEITKVGIRDKLRKFLTRRPAAETLEKQGILQAENVFGSRLQFICDRESTTVPKFVVRCIKTIERKGLDFDGLYRISGNQAQIQKLRFLVDSTEDYNLSEYDVNVLTGALKLFFRELKEPLIPFQLYHILSETIRDKDQLRKARTMKLQLSTMPTVNLDTLKFLFAHLVRVLEHAHENRMRSQNIAIVFGPTLMWPEKESSAIAVNMMCQNSIVEYILSGFDRLF